MAAFVQRRRAPGGLIEAGLILLSVALAYGVVQTQDMDVPLGLALAVSAGAMVALGLMLCGPTVCLAAVAAAAVLPVLPRVSLGAGVEASAADPFFVALVCWWLVRRETTVAPSRGAPGPVPLTPIVVFLGYVGLTLLYVAAVDPGELDASFISWLRLVQVVTLGALAAYFLRSARDVRVMLGALAAAGAVAIIVALEGGLGGDGGPLGVRGGGVLNPDALGLTAGLLIMMAIFPGVTRNLWIRVPLGAVGLVGMIQSQSVGALLGTIAAVVLGLAFAAPPRRSVAGTRALQAAICLVLALVVGYGLASVIRPENVPTSEEFGGSSSYHRAVVGVAGLEIASRHPVIGVGWQRSRLPHVLGAPEIGTELRRRFEGTPEHFFPDVNPTSVHNTYIQLLADLGVIGLGLFVYMLIAIARRTSSLLRRARGTEEWQLLWFLAWAIVLVFIWLNDNPLYGGQTESVVAVLLLGALAGLGKTVLARLGEGVERPRRDPA